MRFPRFRVPIAGLLLVALPAGSADAAVARRGEVAVTSVQFRNEPGPGGRWHVMTVDVAVRPAADNATRYVDRVRVDVELGYEAVAGSERVFEFYRAQATAVTVPAGRASFHFCLPPEVVARDRLSGDLRFYAIELTAAGEPLPLGARQIGPGLAAPGALENFRSQVATEAPANDGVLRPELVGPFGRINVNPPGPTLLSHP